MQTLVVIGFAEAISAPEVLWSLVDSGFQVVAFSRKGRRSALHFSRHVVCHQITPPESDLDAALSDLHSLLMSLDTAGSTHLVLFPLDDSAVWLCHMIPLEPDWILAGPQGDSAELALDKQRQVQAALDAGFNVPSTLLASSSKDILAAEMSLPLMLKPAKATFRVNNRLCGCSTWVCGTHEELHRALTAWGERVPLLIQPFISGTGEGIFGIATAEGVRGWSAHRRLRMMNPKGSGSSACISQPFPAELKPAAAQFITGNNWSGIFMIELLRDQSGTAWFMELNGRPWGSMALARRQGLEYPAWNLRSFIDPQSLRLDERPEFARVTCRNLGRELMHLLFVLRGRRSVAQANWPSFCSALRGVGHISASESFYNWRKDDLKVFFADCCYTIRDQLFKPRGPSL